jgi:hypothetical protein
MKYKLLRFLCIDKVIALSLQLSPWVPIGEIVCNN